MKAIEMETTISSDGKLPSSFREAFGRKARVIVLIEENNRESEQSRDESVRLMELAGKINAFRNIKDPVAFQRKLRDEWANGWDE
jgi:bifunctional DNA-binding transcriptional regulator/antitoxin component of YhaV-PrlF toxin-antitoxin module